MEDSPKIRLPVSERIAEFIDFNNFRFKRKAYVAKAFKECCIYKHMELRGANKLLGLAIMVSVAAMLPYSIGQQSFSQFGTWQYAVFNGTSYINAGTSGLPVTNSARSVFAWVYPTGSGMIFSYGINSEDQMDNLYLNNGMLAFTAIGNHAQSSLAVPTGTWSLVGFTYASNSTSIMMYLDNKSQELNLSLGKPLDTASFGKSSIGKQASCNSPCLNFNGYIGEVRAYETNMTAQEVSSIYYAGLYPGATLFKSALVGWWPLNGTALDYSGEGNAGAYYHLAYGSPSGNYLVSVLSSGNGSISAARYSPLLPEGSGLSIMAQPSVGYEFLRWSCTGANCYNGTATEANLTLRGNTTETADFGKPTYSVFVNSSSSVSGTIFINGSAASHKISSINLGFNYGNKITLSENALPGYIFSNWSCSGPGCYSGTESSPNLTVYGNITETANFKRAGDLLNVETNAFPSAGGTAQAFGSYYFGNKISLTAQPYLGYRFVNWSCTGPGCYSGSERTVTGLILQGNITETAEFALNQNQSSGYHPNGSLTRGWPLYALIAIIILVLSVVFLKHRRHRRRRKHATHHKQLNNEPKQPQSTEGTDTPKPEGGTPKPEVTNS